MKNDNYREFTAKEKEWITAFEKVMSKAPSSLFLFVGEGVSVYPLDTNGERYMKESGSVDNQCPCVSIRTKIQYDGGAY